MLFHCAAVGVTEEVVVPSLTLTFLLANEPSAANSSVSFLAGLP